MKNEIVFSFDTTGSMFPCLTRVRRCVEETVKYLFKNIPDIRIGVIAHGDYIDGENMIRSQKITNKVKDIVDFVRNVPPTYGGDAKECYEYVLNYARTMNWSIGAANQTLVLIGDERPHAVGEKKEGGKGKVVHDWFAEAEFLRSEGKTVIPIHARPQKGTAPFYDKLADLFLVPKLELPQFEDINDILCGICFHQAGRLEEYEAQLSTRKVKPSYHTVATLAALSGKTLSKKSVKIGSKFQVLTVDRDCTIRDFVEENGLQFEPGRGFYELTKREKVQSYKEVVAQNRETGSLIEGDRARKTLDIPVGVDANVKTPEPDSSHIGFVQSTSFNRRLVGGTRFLYEVKG